MRVVIIGGGITGAFAAYFLAARGAEAVIVERRAIAAGASGANAGGLNPLHGPGIPGPMAELALVSLRLHAEHTERLAELSQIDFDARLVPRLIVALSDEEADELAGREALHNATPPLSARWLPASELRRAHPALTPDVVGALSTEGNARVDPARYTEAVARAAQRLGGRIVIDGASGLRTDGRRVTAVELAGGEALRCDAVLVAAGPWSAPIATWLGIELPVRPLKGELLLIAGTSGGADAEITWNGVGVYDAPGGGRWLGGTEEAAGFDVEPTAEGRRSILAGVRRLLPGLEPVRVERHVAGLRPVSADGRPVIGIPNGWDNVCIATGAGRKGMLLAPGIALAAAELLLERRTNVPIAACGLDRWGT